MSSESARLSILLSHRAAERWLLLDQGEKWRGQKQGLRSSSIAYRVTAMLTCILAMRRQRSGGSDPFDRHSALLCSELKAKTRALFSVVITQTSSK